MELRKAILFLKSPLFLVHINIWSYAFFFWVTQPVLPYMAKEYGADPLVLGYLQTLFGAVQLIGGPLMGRVIDVKSGRFALLVSQFASGSSYLLLGSASALPMVFVSRIPTLFMHAMHAAQSCISDITSKEDRAKGLGRLGLSYGIGFVLGPMVGGTLSKYVGYSVVAYFAAAGSFITYAVTYFALPETRTLQSDKTNNVIEEKKSPVVKSTSDCSNTEKSKSKPKLDLSKMFALWQITIIRNCLILKFLARMAMNLFRSNFSAISDQRYALDAQQHGFVLSFCGVIGVLVNSFLVGPSTARFSEAIIIRTNLVILSGSFVFLSGITKFYTLLVCLIPLILSGTIIGTIITSTLTKSVSRNETGTVIGLDMAVNSLCGVIAPTLSGYFMTKFGYEMATYIPAACAGIGAVVLGFITLQSDEIRNSAVTAKKNL